MLPLLAGLYWNNSIASPKTFANLPDPLAIPALPPWSLHGPFFFLALVATHPPVLGSWRRLYAVVLIELALLIGLFWLVTERFR